MLEPHKEMGWGVNTTTVVFSCSLGVTIQYSEAPLVRHTTGPDAANEDYKVIRSQPVLPIIR